MATILKCKICGGDISVNAEMTVGTCQYCGSTMTLPRIDTDKKARLFNRANEYRLNNEFDKAYDAYKTITEEDEQESEAYWGMILSEYGIEYVEDPSNHKRIPTCHRTHVQNIQDSSNYKLALKYADGERRMMYRDEAEALDKLQRNILAISSKEDDYDVFICYKETDDEGNRTKDSVLAQEIYKELEKDGIKTFFSRISLETHIGENYEPYIYGALSSAKVMLVVTMNGDNLDSVWVKNEWKRYLSFMESDETKVIIPVYKGMTAYDFPSELSKFQAQDMGKVGAIQDLIHGIKKILGTTKTKERDSKLDSLIEEKQKRDEVKKYRKRIIKKVAIRMGIGILCVAAGILIFVALSKTIYKEHMITVSNGIPDSKECNSFEATINKDNFDDYFFFAPVEGYDGWYCLQSKIVSEGWYLYGIEDFSYTTRMQTGKGGFLNLTSDYLFPRYEHPYNNSEISLISCQGRVKFVNKAIVKKCVQTFNDNIAYRKIVLKNWNYQEDEFRLGNVSAYETYPEYMY